MLASGKMAPKERKLSGIPPGSYLPSFVASLVSPLVLLAEEG